MLCHLRFLMLALAINAAAVVAGDEIRLRHGGRVVGELADDAGRSVTVRLPQGGKLVLAADQVVGSREVSAEEKRYRELLPRMPRTVEGMWAMAEWCRENGLMPQRERHLQELLELDPNHRAARAALGFVKLDGQWLTTEQWRERQGFVRQGADWVLPQEVLLNKHNDDVVDRESRWKQRVRVLRGMLRRSNAAEAIAELRGIDDPAAAAAFADWLEEEQHREAKLLCIAALGKMTSNGIANTALVEQSLTDADQRVRDAALDELSRNNVRPAVSTFIRALEENDNQMVNRAAVGLARMGDRRAILPLIEALVTEHKHVVGSGGGPGQIGATFGPGGPGGGLSTGGGPKVLKGLVQNPAVREALISLTEGANFGFDKEAWKRWYAEQNVPETVNLRRDS